MGGPWRTVGPTPRAMRPHRPRASTNLAQKRVTPLRGQLGTQLRALWAVWPVEVRVLFGAWEKPRTWRGFLRSSGRVAARRRWTLDHTRTPCRIHRRDEQPHEPQRHRGLPPGDSVSHTTAATTVFGALTGSAHRRDDARADRTVERPAPTARAASPPRSGRRSGRARSPGPRPVRSRAARPRGGRRRGCRRGTRRR